MRVTWDAGGMIESSPSGFGAFLTSSSWVERSDGDR